MTTTSISTSAPSAHTTIPSLPPTGPIIGAEILVRALIAENVKFLWGYPGGAVLHIYDELYKQTFIDHILVRHEQAAVHAADAYARATGDVGVALVTSGPGVTNAVTGIATAYLDSIPLVVITGNVPTHAIGQDAFQECDTVGITRPIVKHNILVKDVRDLAMALKKAFHIARSGRPGPVVVDIPKDVSKAACEFVYPAKLEMRSYNPASRGHSGQIRKAVNLLLGAKRPYIYTGGGVILAEAKEELRQLVRMLGYPCTNTLMGLGAYPATDPLFLGMLGMHGTIEANQAMQNADVVIAIGARFDDRVIGNPKHYAQVERKIIHVDVDPSSISKRVKVDVPIVGDVKDVLVDLIGQIQAAAKEGHVPDKAALAQWWSQINEWRKTNCLRYEKSETVIKPQAVLETLWELTKDKETYICSDVGQHQMWVAQHYKFDEPRRWINSGGLGTMGVGLPYAMGIKHAKPHAEVFTVTGDGSIQMCIQELATCKQYGTAVKVILLNNGYLGMVRQWQQVEYSGRYSHSYMDSLPDFVKLAEAYGHIGMRITRPQDVEGALRESMKITDRVVFMDFVIDPTENVWPMVQAGKGINEMIMAEDL